MAVDNTYFTGFEADLLVVTKNLRVIDVEIKISRADLKADRNKDKWRHASGGYAGKPSVTLPLDWPRGVWKHYYCVADPIWTDALLEFVNPNSGVFTIKIADDGRYQGITVRKKCKPNKTNQPITPQGVVQLGHLANVRMHESYRKLDEMRSNHADEMRSMRQREDDYKLAVARPTFYSEQSGYWRPVRDGLDLTPP